MKKSIKLIAVFLLVAVMAVFMAACSSGSGIAGKTFVYDTIKVDNDDVKQEDLDQALEIFKGMFDSWELSFKSGGKCTMSMGDEEADCTYKEDGSKITLKNEESDETMELKYEDGKITMEDKDTKVQIIFKAK